MADADGADIYVMLVVQGAEFIVRWSSEGNTEEESRHKSLDEALKYAAALRKQMLELGFHDAPV